MWQKTIGPALLEVLSSGKLTVGMVRLPGEEMCTSIGSTKLLDSLWCLSVACGMLKSAGIASTEVLIEVKK